MILVAMTILFSCNTDVDKIGPNTRQQTSNTSSLLQAISIVNEDLVWVSGHQATYCVTKDAGETWSSHQIPGGDSLQWRDIHAFDENNVLLMGAGPGKMSQVRKTTDGGNNWSITYTMDHPDGFIDCMEFWDQNNGIIYGDAIDSTLFILLSSNGGETWTRVPSEDLPAPSGSEGGFAASGSCVNLGENGKAWIATGAGNKARVLFTNDYGKSWTVTETPIISGEAAGITSIHFIGNQGLIAGGDLAKSNEYTNNIAYSHDGGKNWDLSSNPVTKGAFYGADLLKVKESFWSFVCGPNGIDYSEDLGKSWVNLDTANYWAVDFAQNNTGWAVGKDGKILKIELK